jgi:transposase
VKYYFSRVCDFSDIQGATQFLANRNVAVLHHPPYSPDLAPADCFLFPKLKFSLKGRHFQTEEEIQYAVTREHFKNCFPGGHEEVEGTCKQTY